MNHLNHKELTQDDIDMYFFYRVNGIHAGFFDRYFEFIKTARTTFEAFNSANDEYFDLFGDYKYASIHSFRNNLRKHLNS